MAVIFGVIVGLALGLTGGGGSILAVPLLIYGLDVAPKSAIALSLIVVALTALYGVYGAWRHKLLEKRAALIFAAGGIVAAPVGIALGDYIAAAWLLIGFAVLMLAVALKMLISSLRHPGEARVVRGDFETGANNGNGTVCRYSFDGRLRMTAPCGVVLVIMGLLAGFLSGLFGVGGGFVIVPALMLVTEMSIHRAVATSLLIITLIGATGVGSALLSGRSIDWLLGSLFLIGGLLGMAGGRIIASRIAGAHLQQSFAVVILLAGGSIMFQQWDVISMGVTQ